MPPRDHSTHRHDLPKPNPASSSQHSALHCGPQTQRKPFTGRSKWPPSKAAGWSNPEAYPKGYVEDFDEPRTMLVDVFSVLQEQA